MSNWFTILIAAIAPLMGLQAELAGPPTASASSSVQSSIPRLRVGDSLAIQVSGQSQFSGDFTVFGDGSINGPGIGRMLVLGKTVPEVAAMVAARLKTRLRNPEVSAWLRSRRTEVIFVVGAASGSGPVAIVPDMTLLQVLSGVSLGAEPDQVDLTLYRQGQPSRQIDIAAALRQDPSARIDDFQPNDVLTFQPKPFIRVWLLGGFGRQGEVTVRQGLSVYRAIAQLGGINREGLLPEEMSLVIRRGPQEIRLGVKPPADGEGMKLEAGDVLSVEVPKLVRVLIGGEVGAPGEYLVRETTSLIPLFAQARGVTPEGATAETMVFRGEEILRVDASEVLVGETPKRFDLQNGDLVYVPRSKRQFYIFGQVQRSGRILIPERETYRVSEAIAAAGGLSERGTYRRMLLLRPGADGKYVRTVFNLDEFIKDGRQEANPVVQPGDILYVGEPRGFTWATVSQVIGSALLLDSVGRSLR